MSNEEIEVEDKTKGQKRKRAVKKATPAKKKLKAEETVKPPVDESNEDKSESEDGKSKEIKTDCRLVSRLVSDLLPCGR